MAQKKVNPLKHICSGFEIEKNLGIFSEFKIKNNISPHNVAKIYKMSLSLYFLVKASKVKED